MKKLLGAVIAAALLFPPGPASAEMLKNLKVNGQLDMQANSAHNVGDFVTSDPALGANDRIENVVTRLMLGLDWDLLDDVHAKVMLRKNDRAWGTTAVAADQGAGGNQGLIGAAGAADVASNLTVQQANIKIDKLFGHVDTTLGRQFYGDPGDLVLYFGPRDTYGLFVTAIDAARFEAMNDWLSFSGLAGQTAQTASVAVAQNPVNIVGLDLGWKMLPVKVNTGLWNQTTKATGDLGASGNVPAVATGRNDRLYVAHIKVRAEAMGGWANLDLAQNFGDCRNHAGFLGGNAPACSGSNQPQQYRGRAMLLDLGYKAELANIGGLTPWLNFGWGSGAGDNNTGVSAGAANNMNFQSIATDYRPGIINRRFAAANSAAALTTAAGNGVATTGLTNRRVWGLGVKFMPAMAEKLTVGASLWDYRFNNVNNTAAGQFAVSRNKHIGSEWGLTADWKHSENVMLGLGYARFMPAGYIETANRLGAGTAYNGIHLAFADMMVKF